MMSWYAHPKLLTLKLTELPPGYPNGFTFPEGMTPNTADYFGRGWCFCESSVSSMRKDYDYVLDLAKHTGTKTSLDEVIEECAAARPAPLTPAEFEIALGSKAFTSKKADEKMVAQLYEDTFKEEMGEAETLDYSNLQWGDEEVAALCKVLVSGAVPKLKVLNLAGNKIGDVGCAALAEAVGSGAVPKLGFLGLVNNPIGAAAKEQLKAACEARGIRVEF